jgi:hypothetical protein
LNLDTALITVTSAGLWLVGCCAFVSAAQEWVHHRSEKSARQHRVSELCD